MSLVLYKIVGAVRLPENVLSGVSKIEHYSVLATSKALPVRDFVHVNGTMKINGRPTHLVSTELAMGFTTALRDVYKIKSIPVPLELRAIEDVKLRPSYTVGENLRFAENVFAPELSKKLDAGANKVMHSTDLADEITPKIVERNPALKNIFNNLSGKTMRTVGGTLLTFGIGIAAVCIVVNEHRNRLTACNLYYYVNDQLRRCVIPTCTCKNVDCTKDCNYCTVALMNKYLPADMKVDNCVDFKDKPGCAKCPSDDYEKLNINDDDTLVNGDVANSSFVRCQKPTFFEALGDIFGGVSSDLMDIVRGSLNGLNWLVQNLPIIIILSVIGIIIIILISVFSKLGNNKDIKLLAPSAIES